MSIGANWVRFFKLDLFYIQTSITYVFTSTFLAQRDVVRAQAIILTDVGSRALIILLVVAMNWGLIGLASAYAVEGAVSLLIALVLARGRLPKIRLSDANKALFKQYIAFAAPLAISSILGTFALFFDKIIIQYSNTAAETGIYFASQRLISFYLALSPVIASVVFPAISHLDQQTNGKEKIERVTSSLIRYLFIVMIPIMFFLVFFSREILSIFLSSSFAVGDVAFSILAIGGFVTITMISPFTSQILGMGMSRVYAKYQIMAIIITIILDIIMIPSSLFSIPLLGWGINGAAIALLIGQLIIAVAFFANARKILQLRLPEGILRTTAAGALAILLVFVLSEYINIARFYDIIALFALHGGIFICLLILFRVMTFNEIKGLIKMFRPKYLLHRPLN